MKALSLVYNQQLTQRDSIYNNVMEKWLSDHEMKIFFNLDKKKKKKSQHRRMRICNSIGLMF